MPKPADLAVLGLRPHDYFTVTRSLSTLTAAAARNGVLGQVDAHLTDVSVAFPTNCDSAALRDPTELLVVATGGRPSVLEAVR